MKGLDALKMLTLAGGMALASSACDDTVTDSNSRARIEAALTSFPGNAGKFVNELCTDFSIIPNTNDVICRDFQSPTQTRLSVVQGAAGNGEVQIVPIANTDKIKLPVAINGSKFYAGHIQENWDVNLVNYDLDAQGVITKGKNLQAPLDSTDLSLCMVNDSFVRVTYGGQILISEKDSKIWTEISLGGLPAGLKVTSIKPYFSTIASSENVVINCFSEAKQTSYTFLGGVDESTMSVSIVGSAFKTPCIQETGHTTNPEIRDVNGCVTVAEICQGGLYVSRFGGLLCDENIPEPDAVADAVSDADVVTPPDTSDLGPDLADGDTTADGMDTGVDGSTDVAEPMPDAEVQELPQEEVSSPDAEIDNGEEVTDAMTDGDGGEGPDVVEVSETDGSNGPDATPDVVVKNVCEQLGAVVNQPQVTLSVENGECVVTTENADGEVRVDFIGGDATGFITVKPKNAGEVARFSDGATSIPTGSVLNGLNATLTGSGTIEDGLNGGFMSSAVPGAKTTTTVIGGANVGDVPNGTTIKTVDGVTEVTAGPTDGVRVIATCLPNGKIIDIQLEAGESNKKDPCAEDVIPPKPSSGGGCNVAGEGNHKNGVGDLGAELLLGLVGLFAVNRRRLAKVLGFA